MNQSRGETRMPRDFSQRSNSARDPTASALSVSNAVRGDDDQTSERSSYAALVQSAAKSLIDTSTSQVSDDDDDGGSSFDDSSMTMQSPDYANANTSSKLKSLEIQQMPALPDEQDRKRFIGCLAAVLASSYEYDYNLENLEQTAEDDVTNSFAYFDVDDEDDRDRMEITRSQGGGVQRASNFSEIERSSHSTMSQRSSRQQLSQEIDLVKKARNRHRRRRYDIFSGVLLSAADLLMLDKSQAKAFLPMLGRLLVPPTKTAEEVQRANNNTGSVAGLRTRPSFQRNKAKRESKKAPSESDAASLSCQSMTDSRHSSQDEWNEPPVAYRSDPGISVMSAPALTTMDRAFPETDGPSPQGSRDEIGEDDRYFLLDTLDDSDILRPFLESLSPGSGFRCLSLMLLQHLLKSPAGYDARVRHVFKKVGVIVLVHEMDREVSVYGPDGVEREKYLSDSELVEMATRKFEALEHGIASKLIRLSEIQRKHRGTRGTGAASSSNSAQEQAQQQGGISRRQLVRGLKIGSAGLVAGTLFAVTGGLAAPGIAAGIAAIAGGTAATAAVVTLTSTAAVTAIFGVGGGSLAAYKMQRRTQGLTEFSFTKESDPDERRHGKGGAKVQVEAELFSTICISGWLRDRCDFQRPWGVTPSDPKITDKMELLERFYRIHKPDHLPKCARILTNWKDEEKELWHVLKQKYGRDPDHLFPLLEGPRIQAALTLEQDELLNQLFVELGHASPEDEDKALGQSSPLEKMKSWSFRGRGRRTSEPSGYIDESEESPLTLSKKEAALQSSLRGQASYSGPPVHDGMSSVSSALESAASSSTKASSTSDEPPEKEYKPPKHLQTVWDYQATYGGEQYTVKWESELLLELSDSVTSLAVDVLEKAGTQVLKQTVLATLLSAVALPAALVSAANLIDGTWTLASERADEAGRELAKSLLYSPAGRRPITLVGFSMGARIIYACLKELARYQEKWEDARAVAVSELQSGDSANKGKGKKSSSRASSSVNILETMREPASIVEDAILMGLPNHLNLKSWVACRQVVAGRLVNCYSRKDLILSLMYRYKKMSIARKVCGTNPIDIPGVENVDVTHLLGGHEDYCVAAGNILKYVRQGQPFRSQQTSVNQNV